MVHVIKIQKKLPLYETLPKSQTLQPSSLLSIKTLVFILDLGATTTLWVVIFPIYSLHCLFLSLVYNKPSVSLMECCSTHILGYICPYLGFIALLVRVLVLCFWRFVFFNKRCRIFVYNKSELQQINKPPHRRLYQTVIGKRVCRIVRSYQLS